MLLLLSPAKSLDYESPVPSETATDTRLDIHSKKLAQVLKKKSAADLRELMGISESLAQLNAERFAQWNTPMKSPEARQAVFAFQGDVYQGLKAEDFSEQELNYAQKHIRILSGLYGVLRPLDLMLPYRLEMGTSLAVNGTENLYQFWGDELAKLLKSDLMESGSDVIVNLASNEYFNAVKKGLKGVTIVTPAFKDFKNGEYKMISFFAKKARGMMARFAVQNGISNPEDLKAFDHDGYIFNKELSKEKSWVFTRG